MTIESTNLDATLFAHQSRDENDKLKKAQKISDINEKLKHLHSDASKSTYGTLMPSQIIAWSVSYLRKARGPGTHPFYLTHTRPICHSPKRQPTKYDQHISKMLQICSQIKIFGHFCLHGQFLLCLRQKRTETSIFRSNGDN